MCLYCLVRLVGGMWSKLIVAGSVGAFPRRLSERPVGEHRQHLRKHSWLRYASWPDHLFADESCFLRLSFGYSTSD
jgi:hypothetical protein